MAMYRKNPQWSLENKQIQIRGENPEKRNDTQKWQIQHQVFLPKDGYTANIFTTRITAILFESLEPCNYIGVKILYFPIPCKELPYSREY